MSDETASFPIPFERYRIARAVFRYARGRMEYAPNCNKAFICFIEDREAYVRESEVALGQPNCCAYARVVNHVGWHIQPPDPTDTERDRHEIRMRSFEGHWLTIWLTDDPPLPPEPAGFT